MSGRIGSTLNYVMFVRLNGVAFRSYLYETKRQVSGSVAEPGFDQFDSTGAVRSVMRRRPWQTRQMQPVLRKSSVA